jgi:hypothetical protein
MTNNKPFYEILPDGRMAFYIDATLVKDFNICEQRFFYRHIRNLRSKRLGGKEVKPFSMAIGGWWSDCMEEMYNQLGSNIALSAAQIQQIALVAWAANDIDESAKAQPDQFDKFGDLAGGVLMLQQYYDSQYAIDRSTWKVLGTETGFGYKNEVLIGETNKVVVWWVGKPDLLVIEGDRLLPVDHKTVTKIDGRTISKYKPGPQMPGYCFAVETIAKSIGVERRVDRCVVNICAREKPSDKPRDGKRKPRFVRALPQYTKEEITEFRTQMLRVGERLRHCLMTQDWLWRDSACHNIYMRPCEYLQVCSNTPMSRDIVLASSFEYSPPWRPYTHEKKEGDE